MKQLCKKCLTEKLKHFNMLIIRTHCNNGGLSLKTIFTILTLGTCKTWNQIHEINHFKQQIKQTKILNKRFFFMCKWKSVCGSLRICTLFSIYSPGPLDVYTYKCVPCIHISELCSLTKHLFCTHMHACGAWWSSPNLQPGKVSAFFDVGPIDHHYYCSLLIPMEMRPGVVVLGDWSWGQGLPPLALLQNIKSS